MGKAGPSRTVSVANSGDRCDAVFQLGVDGKPSYLWGLVDTPNQVLQGLRAVAEEFRDRGRELSGWISPQSFAAELAARMLLNSSSSAASASSNAA
jgi:hypothetical protein